MTKFMTFAAVSVLIYFGIALGLILSQRPADPRNDDLSDVAKLPPFLLISGAEDDAFHADQFEPTMTQATDKGTYTLLPGVDHIGITRNAEALGKIVEFLNR